MTLSDSFLTLVWFFSDSLAPQSQKASGDSFWLFGEWPCSSSGFLNTKRKLVSIPGWHLTPKKPLTRVSRLVIGAHGRGAWRGVGRKGWQRVGALLAQGSEGLAKGWQRIGGFPCTLQLRNSRGARLEDRVCDSMGHSTNVLRATECDEACCTHGHMYVAALLHSSHEGNWATDVTDLRLKTFLKSYRTNPISNVSRWRGRKTMTATDVTGIDSIFPAWNCRHFLQCYKGFPYQINCTEIGKRERGLA